MNNRWKIEAHDHKFFENYSVFIIKNLKGKEIVRSGFDNENFIIPAIRDLINRHIEYLTNCSSLHRYQFRTHATEVEVLMYNKSESLIGNIIFEFEDYRKFTKENNKEESMRKTENCSEGQAYLTLHNKTNIQVGDFVKVLRKVEPGECGWNNTWDEQMDEFVGRVGKVIEDAQEMGFKVQFDMNFKREMLFDNNYWLFPFFALEVVDKKPKFDFSDLETVKQLHRELWQWLENNPEVRDKSKWPRWEENGGDVPNVANHCFLCEYAKIKHDKENAIMCKQCPANWLSNVDSTKYSPCLDSLFGTWAYIESAYNRDKGTDILKAKEKIAKAIKNAV